MHKLLIADDEMIERKVLYKTLCRNFKDQCEIYEAANGREALELFEKHKIRIAIMDIEMPGINGIVAAEEMRKRDPACCIIFLTAFDDFNYAKKAITIRALDYLLKPYDDQELIQVVGDAIHVAEKYKKFEYILPADEMLPEEAEDPLLEETGVNRLSRVKETIVDYIRDHYQEEISMQDAARVMHYSEPYFCKLFKQIFNQNFTAYLTNYRIEEAKRKLELPTVNVKDVGISVGYMDSNYFAKVFKRTTGYSPSEYRNNLFQKKE